MPGKHLGRLILFRKCGKHLFAVLLCSLSIAGVTCGVPFKIGFCVPLHASLPQRLSEKIDDGENKLLRINGCIFLKTNILRLYQT